MYDALLVVLEGLVGADHVLTGGDCAGFATDIWLFGNADGGGATRDGR